MSENRQRTSTSAFGVSRRKGMMPPNFTRFNPPVLTSDETVNAVPDLGDGCLEEMPVIASSTRLMRCLVVTSPPYFVGKEYEDSIAADADDRVPTTYFEYLGMLDSVLPNVCEFWNPVEESQLTLRILVASLTEVCQQM